MPVTRRYSCDECGWTFLHLHLLSSEPQLTDCPACNAAAIANMPTSFNMTSIKAKAVDATYRIAEETMGVTNMKDNAKVGETSVVAPPPMQTSENDKITHELMQMDSAATERMKAEGVRQNMDKTLQGRGGYGGFFQSGMTMPSSNVMAAAAHGATVSRHEGHDPVGMLHAMGKKGELPKDKVIGRTDKSGRLMTKVTF